MAPKARGHRVTVRANHETGRETRTIVIDGRRRLEGEALRIAIEHLKHTARGNTDFEYVLGDIVAALNGGSWPEETAAVILGEIERARQLAALPAPPDVLICIGIRIGRLVTEAARAAWPIVTHGRARQRAQSAGGRARGRQRAQQAAREDAVIRKRLREWQASDVLQDEYRSPAAYIARRTSLPRRTIERRLRRLRH